MVPKTIKYRAVIQQGIVCLMGRKNSPALDKNTDGCIT